MRNDVTKAGFAETPDEEAFVRQRVKAELRKRMRGVRKTMPVDACLARSLAIVRQLEMHSAMIAARSVALFWPMRERHEVDLRSLDASLRKRGVRIAYPSLGREHERDSGMMTMRYVDDARTMEERGSGFAEPDPDAEEAIALDVIVVPALAVDPQGHRIGYGAGYYDRTLQRFAPPAVTIAVAYDWQLIAEVPAMPYDVACSAVVTDARVIVVTS